MTPALPFARYMLLECWAAPGFDMFWRRWSPLAGFALYRLYVLLGGHRRPVVATVAVFALSGALHDLVFSLAFGVISITLTIAWCFFAAACLACGVLAKHTGLRRWPRPALVLLNVSLVLIGLGVGYAVQIAVFGGAAA